MPVFNAAATVARAVASVRAQSFFEWELVAVDDGSTDGTREILQALAKEEPRLQLQLRPHEGLVASLNAGLAVAGGEFVARLDADDEAHPERLAAQLAFSDAHPDVGLVSCLVEFGGDRAASAGYALHVDWLNALVTPGEIALNRFIESPLAHPSVFFRRQLVSQHGGYRDGDFPEDYELWLRLLDAGVRMGKVPVNLLTWHDAPGRLSRCDARYGPEAFFRVKAPYVAREVARRAHGRPIFVWGAGRPTRKRAAYLETHGVVIAGYIDIDPKKTGRTLAGRPVLDLPTAVAAREAMFILVYVSNRGARELIRAELRARGYGEGEDFLVCA
jgi:glycosyltransferase involved in cell wall biosynthesis